MHKKMIRELNKLSNKCDTLLMRKPEIDDTSLRFRLYLLGDTARMHASLLEWLFDDDVQQYDYKESLYWQNVALQRLIDMRKFSHRSG